MWERAIAGLADVLLRLGMADFDVNGARGPSRDLTQRITRWAYEHGFAGVAYRSRFADDLDCWAIFEGNHGSRSDGRCRFATTILPCTRLLGFSA